MKKAVILLVIFVLMVSLSLAGCTSNSSAETEQQMKRYQEQIVSLEQQNQQLKLENEKYNVSLYKIEETLFALEGEGSLPFTGTQVNAPELFEAMKDIKELPIEINQGEIVLSMMPQEWSKDFGIILMRYEVYKALGNIAEESNGRVTTMAGIYQKGSNGWELLKFTKEFKGDESFTVKDFE